MTLTLTDRKGVYILPREPRLINKNYCYHIIARSEKGRRIFPAASDCMVYVKLFKKYKRKAGVKVFAFSILPYRVHLVVQPREAEGLSKFMQGLQQSYAKYFNRKYESTGNIWRGRYQSIAITEDEVLIDCIKYVEFTPVKADVALTPVEYPFSSCTIRVMGYKNSILDSMPTERDGRESLKSSPYQKTRSVEDAAVGSRSSLSIENN